MKRFLFLLGTEADGVDHMVPLAWKCLEQGDAVVALFHKPFPHETDARFALLRQFPRFEVRRLPGVAARRRSVSVASQLLWPRWRVRRLLRGLAVDACFVPWGKGARVTRRTVRSHLRRPLRRALIGAALDLGLPRFCVPSGMPTIVRVRRTTAGVERLRPRPPGFRADPRDCFTVYVVNNDAHRDWVVLHHGLDPALVQNWGSVRFCPEWRRTLTAIAPPAALPAPRPGQRRLLLFLPKWAPFVDRAGTIRLVRALAARDDVQLVVKTHPHRGTAQLVGPLGAELAARPNVVLEAHAGSIGLIAVSDAALLVHTSIGVEVLLQGKPLVHAAYLHPNRTIYDDHPGCLTTRAVDEVHAIVDRLAGGERLVDPAAAEAANRPLVYGGREPFDVMAAYHARIHEYLAGARPRRAAPVSADPAPVPGREPGAVPR